MKSTPLILLVAVMALDSAAHAQPRIQKQLPTSKQSQAEKPLENQVTYATVPIDLLSENLGANYAGHSCRKITAALLEAKPLKDEYETTDAFNARIAALSIKTFTNSITLNDYIGFVPIDSSVSSKYNADAGLLEISGRDRSIIASAGKSSRQTLVIDSKLTSEKQYAASNAYGRQTEVLKTEHNVCAIAVMSIPTFEEPIKFQGTVTMSAQEAQSAKGKIETLYVGRLTAPYYGEYFKSSAPKITFPFEDHSRGDTLFMNISEVWLFNKVTGQVYQKIKLQPM